MSTELPEDITPARSSTCTNGIQDGVQLTKLAILAPPYRRFSYQLEQLFLGFKTNRVSGEGHPKSQSP
jgi:hypothetical protein